MMSTLIFWVLRHLGLSDMGAADNLITNSNKVAYTNYWPTDKVLYSTATSITVNNSVSIGHQVFTFPSPIGSQRALPIGIFSTDGGVTWNDVGGDDPSASFLNGIVAQAVSVTIEIQPDGTTTVLVKVNSAIGGGSTFLLNLSFVLLGISGVSAQMPVPTISSGTTKTATTNITPSSKLPVAYRQIVNQATLPASAPAGANVLNTSPHNLSYVPDLIFWRTDNGTPTQTFTFGTIYTRQTSTTGMYMDATNIYWWAALGITNYDYRIYRP